MSDPKNRPLEQLQQWMQEQVIPQVSSGELNWPLTEMVASSNRLDAAGHLAIYQRSYVARLRDCMSKQFTALEFALGPELFQHFADAYLQAHPPQSYNLADLGERFPLYLHETRPDGDTEVKEDWPDFIIELAQFEHQVNVVFDFKSDEQFTSANALTEDVNIDFIPVFRQYAFQYPVADYYRAFKNELSPELPLKKHSFSAIYRRQYQLGLLDLTWPQFLFIHHQRKGVGVHQALQILTRELGWEFSKAESAWKAWKQSWLKAGILCTRAQ